MITIMSIQSVISLLPIHMNPFNSLYEMLKHLDFVFSQKHIHSYVLKSCDNQAFCALKASTYSRSMLLDHFKKARIPLMTDDYVDFLYKKMDELPKVQSWDSRLDLLFKSISLEKAQYFSI